MKYDFDKVPERRGTHCVKYDAIKMEGKPEDLLPLWVADMDFPAPSGVIERLKEMAEHGIFGYNLKTPEYYAAVSNWYRSRFGWETEASWLVTVPGVVFALAAAVRAFTEKGDAVLIQQPVYHPFSDVIEQNERRLINSPLLLKNGKYEMDLADFEAKIVENQVKLYLLCSPHNPVGRVWSEAELRAVADICLKHGVRIVSDEIHSDFVYAGYQHHMLASLSDAYANITVTCTAPSKTFNLAGLQASNIFIPNETMRNAFSKELARTAYGELNGAGMTACQAAYETGEEWLEQLKTYLAGNLEYVRTFLKERLPEVALIEPQGTYLLWLDFRALGLEEAQLEELLVKKAKLWFNNGSIFGEEGNGFQRVNIACTRKMLMQAFEQLEQAIHS